jgi:tRNA U34 2-thiouridine synthase MnmA/TrmU
MSTNQNSETLKTKALALLSGGLDSTLAVKLILDLGIEVIAVNFKSPFCLCDQKGKCFASGVAENFEIPLKIINKGKEYLDVIRHPKFGYGSGMNPCIDCRIFMLKKVKEYAKEIGAKFIFTGEVLNERPMSQHKSALDLIEKEAGLEAKILRPLSAQLLPETEAEKNGWVDRNKLLAIKGRSRKPQIALAREYGIDDYPCPSGGCLLTYKGFANKVKDLFEHKESVTLKDIHFLKAGRHFRFGKNKIIVGKNEKENEILLRLNKKDYFFEVPNYGSPITILQGEKTKEAITFAAVLTATYSDAKDENEVLVKYGQTNLSNEITVTPLNKQEIDDFRVC